MTMRVLRPPRAAACGAVGNGSPRSGGVVLEAEESDLDDDEPYDDEQDHTRCADCHGSGYYVGFMERRLCPTCDGSGFL